jgi:hypothetical protein
MAIVMISSISKQGRMALALHLAKKTGWPCLSREDLLEEAVAKGIKVGRLEVSMIKAPGNQERLAREKQIYLAFITEMLCRKADLPRPRRPPAPAGGVSSGSRGPSCSTGDHG